MPCAAARRGAGRSWRRSPAGARPRGHRSARRRSPCGWRAARASRARPAVCFLSVVATGRRREHRHGRERGSRQPFRLSETTVHPSRSGDQPLGTAGTIPAPTIVHARRPGPGGTVAFHGPCYLSSLARACKRRGRDRADEPLSDALTRPQSTQRRRRASESLCCLTPSNFVPLLAGRRLPPNTPRRKPPARTSAPMRRERAWPHSTRAAVFTKPSRFPTRAGAADAAGWLDGYAEQQLNILQPCPSTSTSRVNLTCGSSPRRDTPRHAGDLPGSIADPWRLSRAIEYDGDHLGAT